MWVLICYICATLSRRASLESLVSPLLHFQVSEGPIIPRVLFRCPTHGPCHLNRQPPALSLPSLSEGLLCLRWALRIALFLPPFPQVTPDLSQSVFTASWHESRSFRDHIFFTPCLKTPLHKNTQAAPRASILRRQSGKWGRRDYPIIWVTKMVAIWSLDVVFVPHHEWHGRWDIISAQRPHWYPNAGNCEMLR